MQSEGKPRYHLRPIDVTQEVLKAYEHGCVKHEPFDWEKGYRWSEYYNKINRHLDAWMTGEREDPESGVHHLAKLIADAEILLAYDLRGGYEEFDDRRKIKGGEHGG